MEEFPGRVYLFVGRLMLFVGRVVPGLVVTDGRVDVPVEGRAFTPVEGLDVL